MKTGVHCHCPVRIEKKKKNCCTCFMLSVTFAPAAPLHTWECIDKCPYVVHWLTGIDDVTLFVMATKTKPLQCAPTRARWAGQREQHPAEKIFIQIRVRIIIVWLVAHFSFIVPSGTGIDVVVILKLSRTETENFKEPVYSAQNPPLAFFLHNSSHFPIPVVT